MILAQSTENGLSWSLDAKGMNIYIRVIQDSTKKEFVKKNMNVNMNLHGDMIKRS
jgi:hypothetical protein